MFIFLVKAGLPIFQQFLLSCRQKNSNFPAKNTKNSGCQLCQSYEMNHKKNTQKNK